MQGKKRCKRFSTKQATEVLCSIMIRSPVSSTCGGRKQNVVETRNQCSNSVRKMLNFKELKASFASGLALFKVVILGVRSAHVFGDLSIHQSKVEEEIENHHGNSLIWPLPQRQTLTTKR